MKFPWMMPATTCWINKKDLRVMGLLLSKGYPIGEALRMLDEKYIGIVEKLEEGEKLEQFIPFHKKNSFYSQLKFFMSVSPMHEAIEIAFDYEKLHQNLLELVLKQITYPIFVLCLAIGVFFLFEIMIYPQLLTFVSSAEQNPLFFQLMHFILIMLFLLLFVLLVFIALIHFNRDFYHLVFDKFLVQLPFIKSYVSYQFASYLLLFMRKGYATRQILQALCHLSRQSPLSWLAADLNQMSESGQEYMPMINKHVYLTDSFCFFFRIGYYASTLESTLKDYLDYQQDQFQRHLKYFSIAVSLFSYGFIAVLVAMIYQMLLSPLEMLTIM